MNVFIVGSTGFIGRNITAYLQGQGHCLTAWVRNLDKAKNSLGNEVRFVSDYDIDLEHEMNVADAVINVAGEQLSGVRWSKRKKQDFYSSRIDINDILVTAMLNCDKPPKTFLAASAIGYYAESFSEIKYENSPGSNTFLGKLCADWENSANRAAERGIRVCNLRFGLAIGREGGILNQMSMSFEYGIGANLGKGNHKFSWIHIVDLVRSVGICLQNDCIFGPVNITSPHPVKFKEFVTALADNTAAFCVLPVPLFLLKIIYGFGESAKHLTNSHNIFPNKLLESGFKFKFPSIIQAIRHEYNSSDVNIIRYKTDKNDPLNSIKSEYFKNSKAQYELNTRIYLNSDARTVFNFFSSPLNLGMATPSWLGFKILTMPEQIQKKAQFEYRIKLGPVPFRWVTEIAKWNQGETFIDFQRKGPYTLWWHEHRIFDNDNNSSVMEDRILYTVPFGVLGRLGHFLFVKKTLNKIFNYRRRVIYLRFKG